jgi:hypothetical protein
MYESIFLHSKRKVFYHTIIITTMTSTTAKTYKVMLESIRIGLKAEQGYDFLLQYDDVCKWLETNPTKKTKQPLSKSSLKTYYSMIKATLRDLKDDRFKDVMKQYDEKFNEFAVVQKERDEKQELSAQETKKWLCWSCIDGLRDKLYGDYRENNDWKTFQEYLIICLYTLMPPERLDYSPMRFVGDMPTDDKENYCVLLPTKAVFILNAYKTAWRMEKGILTHKPSVYEAPPTMFNILEQWRKLNRSEWLIVKRNTPAGAMSSHELGQTIQRICQRETNTPATLNIIRHSYITHLREGEMPLLEKKRIAERMGHSLSTAEKYIRINAV